jgi:beta-N-acetylglucosaminidase
MNSIRKICFSLLAASLVFSNLGGIAQAETDEASNVSVAVVTANPDEVINLYKEPSEESEVLVELPNDSEITLLPGSEEESPFSLVSYYDSEADEELEGYVLSSLISTPKGPETNQDDETQGQLNNDDSTDVEDHATKEEDASSDEDTSLSDGVVEEEGTSDEESTEPADVVKDGESKETPEASDTIKDEEVQTEMDKDTSDSEKVEDEEEQSKMFSTFSNSVKVVGGETYKGIALKSPTSVYEAQSLSSKKLKSYDQGSILKYQALNSEWYLATVILNGKATTGYIAKSDVENITTQQTDQKGVGLQSPTKVYSHASEQSNVLKSYDLGSVLSYRTFTSGWYECTVYVNGKATTGYIKAGDVKDLVDVQVSLKGVAKQNTPIYSAPSSNGSTIKSYPAGSVLVYKTFIDGWYEAVVYVNGKRKTGYINATHVENVTNEQMSLKGVAKNSPTSIYSDASTSSEVLKSYNKGSVLVYKTFISGWYEAVVYVNGKRRTGYINSSHVENVTNDQVSLKGVAKNTPTSIYSDASTGSDVLKSYDKGSVLVYKTFINGWYEAVVYVNGKRKKGYINASHVENSVEEQASLQGIGLQSSTKVYADANGSSVLKSYPKGTILSYTTFVSGWYEAVVYVNGKKMNGYIDASHVENLLDRQEDLEGISLKSPTNVYSLAAKESSVLKGYPKGNVLNFKTFSSNWYEAVVYINGVRHTGYIHKDDIQTLGTDVIQDYTSYGMTFDEMLALQMKNNPQTDLYRNEPAYIWADYVNPSTGTVTEDRVNVRSSMSTASNANIVSMVNEGDRVVYIQTVGDWAEVRITWKNAKAEDVAHYLNPTNFVFGSKEYYQFLKLSLPANLSVAEVNEKVLAGKGILAGKGQAFIDAANKYKVNEVYLISHALLETGNGTSSLATGTTYNGKTVYNMYGYGAFDSCPLECGARTAYEQEWFTPEAAIIGGAKLISSGYIYRDGFQQDTLYKMRWNPEGTHQYATDIGWAAKQVDSIFSLYSLLDNYTLYFDKPYYEVK